MPILVKDIMTKKVFTIDADETAKDAATLMKKIRRGCLIVTKNNFPVGIVTDTDLITKVLLQEKKASKVKVKEIMSKPLVTVRPEDEISVAIKKIMKNNFHRLPVVSRERVIGIISLTDIARTVPGRVDLLEYRLKMKEIPFEIKEEFTSGICDSCGHYSEDLKNIDDKWLCETCREEIE